MRSDKLLENMTRILSGKLMEGDELTGQVSFDQYQKDLKEQRKGKYKYETQFHLECPVNDFEEAYNYLLEDDMAQYLKGERSPEDQCVTNIEWILEDEESGKIVVYSTRELTQEELANISDWIRGQNSDGLGESFEQQPFAECYYNPVTGDGPYNHYEAQNEIQNLFDEITVDDVVNSGELNGAIWDAVETYKDNNEGAEDMSDDEIFDMIADDVESYIDWEDIEDAKYKFSEMNPEYNENNWYNMASFDWKTNDYRLHRVDNIGSTQESKKLVNKYKLKEENEKETSDLMDLLQQVFDNEDDWEIEEQGDEICVRYINDEYLRVCSNMDSSANYDNEDFDTSKEYSLSQLEKIKKDILESVKEHIEYYNDSNNDYKDYCGGDDPYYDQSNWNSYNESKLKKKEIVAEATNLQDMRNSYIDSFKHRGYEEYKSGDNYICLIDKKDQPVVVMFYGKAGKPTWHYRFRNMQEVDQYINNYLGQKDVQAKIKANRRAERKITRDHDVKVGDIFVSNWGYEQTNIEFYEVVDVKGSRIYLKELANEYLDSDEYTCDKIMPKKGQYVDDEVHTMSARANGTFTNLDGASYMTMRKWDGKPQYPTNSMFGH